jgi:hypothetical protein
MSALLEELAPAVPIEEPAWDDVLVRAALLPELPAERRMFSRRRRRLVAIALAGLALVVVAAALAAGGLHRFSAWLSGSPGAPAPAADQRGFARRNAAAFARFPRDTEVRLLMRTRAGGKTFKLLGFRAGGSLCLRVVRADDPGARGANECASLAELEQSAAPAVVIDSPFFSFGQPELSGVGVYGFAADGVKQIEVVRERSGRQVVTVSSNAFLALRVRPSGTVARHPPPDPITGVFAVTSAGTRVRLAYTSEWAATRAPPPRPPFYLGSPRVTPSQLPGPAKADRPFTGGTISWVFRRKRYGRPLSLSAGDRRHLGTILFARSIQPDPTRPDRIALMVVRLPRHGFGPQTPSYPVLCTSPLRPLGQLMGMTCFGTSSRSKSTLPFPQRGSPLGYTFMWPAQVAHVAGVAADAVASITVFLGNGRVIPVPLRHNAFIVDVPQSIPAKIVGYDRDGRAISVALITTGPTRYIACPRAAAPAAIGPARPYERLDLEGATLNGHAILGAGESEVVAALGKPDRILHNTIENGVPIPAYLYGGVSQLSATTQIQFGRDRGRIVAVNMSFRSPRLVEQRLGHLLAMQPADVQREITKTYPRYRLDAGYGTIDAHGCSLSFTRGRGGRHIGLYLGLDVRGTRGLNLIVRRGY